MSFNLKGQTRGRLLRSGSLSAIAGILIVCGCGDSPEGTTGIVVRDSAGVTIVETPGWSDGAVSLEIGTETPELELGVLEGAAEYQFSGVKGIGRLEDGTLAVLNSQPAEIRLYDLQGTFLGRIGSQGQGPEEFMSPETLHVLPGDTLVVFDRAAQRFTVMDSEGHLIRTASLQRPVSHIVGFLDPTIAVAAQPTTTLVMGQPIGEPQKLAPELFERVGLTTHVRDTIAILGGREHFYSQVPINGRTQTTIMSVPFTVPASAAVEGGMLYATDGTEPEVRVYDLDGTLLRIVRVERPRVPVTPEDVERVIGLRLTTISDPAREREARSAFAQMSLPEVMPPFDGLFLSDREDIWIREYDPFPGDTATWTVLSPDGEVVASALLPTDLEVRYIGSEVLVGVRRDEFDVEYIVQLRIR